MSLSLLLLLTDASLNVAPTFNRREILVAEVNALVSFVIIVESSSNRRSDSDDNRRCIMIMTLGSRYEVGSRRESESHNDGAKVTPIFSGLSVWPGMVFLEILMVEMSSLTDSCPGTELVQKITLTVNISVNIGPIEII